jgi:hypothetical protein
MRFYTKLIDRTLALEGWFEKPKNRLFGKILLRKKRGKNPVMRRTYFRSGLLPVT